MIYRENGDVKVVDQNTQVVDTVLTNQQMVNVLFCSCFIKYLSLINLQSQVQASSYSVSPSWNKMLVRYDDRSVCLFFTELSYQLRN